MSKFSRVLECDTHQEDQEQQATGRGPQGGEEKRSWENLSKFQYCHTQNGDIGHYLRGIKGREMLSSYSGTL